MESLVHNIRENWLKECKVIKSLTIYDEIGGVMDDFLNALVLTRMLTGVC